MLCTILFLCVSSASFAETVDSGAWGSLAWSLDDGGTLTISGDGEMDAFDENSTEAWRSHKRSIKTVDIASSVTSIGSYAQSYAEQNGFAFTAFAMSTPPE